MHDKVAKFVTSVVTDEWSVPRFLRPLFSHHLPLKPRITYCNSKSIRPNQENIFHLAGAGAAGRTSRAFRNLSLFQFSLFFFNS
jgi:hypothetical protein